MLLTLLLLLAIFSTQNCHAQSSPLGIANYYQVSGQNIQNGNIISSVADGYSLSKIEYDPTVLGIVTHKAAIVFGTPNTSGDKYPITSTGNILVNVSTAGGAIKKGDPITSSTNPGVGIKATHSGYIIGNALEDYTVTDTKAIKPILIALNIRYFATKTNVKSNLTDVFALSTIATYEEPLTVFKYFIAAFIAIISMVFGLSFFGKVSSHGIDALGRNPLAKNTIQLGILLNVIIAVVVTISGLGLALYIIRL